MGQLIFFSMTLAMLAVIFAMASCAAPSCTDDPDGSRYRGQLAKTLSGRTCQRWTSQSPHRHRVTTTRFPNGGLGDHNYCRNPDRAFTAWCYTTDPSVNWEYCAVGDFSRNCTNPECYTSAPKATDYRGNVAKTRSGRTCQKWTSQTPHNHINTPQNKPNKGLGDHNFCRNPDESGFAWCYTTDPDVRDEFCNIGVPQKSC